MTTPSRKAPTSPPKAPKVPLLAGALIAIPMPNGRYAAIWVLAVGDAYRVGKRLVKKHAYFVVVEGTWPALPAPEEVAARHHAKVAPLSGVWKGVFWGAVPADFVVLGMREPTAEHVEMTTTPGTMVFQDAEHVRAELYRHWRLEHDRPALEAEWQKAEDARERAKAERRARLTLPDLLREKPFAHWRSHWSLKVAREANTIVAEATQALIDLDGGTKRERIAILKGIVTRFNDLYDREGCIETGEAHEVVARVEELGRLVDVSNDDEALTGHRDW